MKTNYQQTAELIIEKIGGTENTVVNNAPKTDTMNVKSSTSKSGGSESFGAPKKKWTSSVVETISGCMTPMIPALTAAAISAIMGITEPAIYGITLKIKRPMIMGD